MCRVFVLPIIVVAAPLLFAADDPSLGPVESLFDVGSGAGMTEGPTCAPDGSVWFSDIASGEVAGRILRFDPRTRETSVVVSDSRKANGLAFDAEGRLIICEGADHGGRRVSRHDPRTGQTTSLVEAWEGKRLNSPNDLAIDARGRIWFTDPRYAGHEPRELDVMGVYRRDPDGSVGLVTRAV